MCSNGTCAAMAHVQQWHMCSSGTCARFNSKLVRIRSVRGAMNCATTSQEDKGFNSKLVRIRSVRGAMNCATTSQEDKGFNSKLVRLEDEMLWECSVILITSFNSKLVRLEGTAGSVVYLSDIVSIPNWFD